MLSRPFGETCPKIGQSNAMVKPSAQKPLRTNPFWTYRDPLTGRWVTVMTSRQCRQASRKQVFTPQTRQPSGDTAATLAPKEDISRNKVSQEGL